MSLLCSDRAPQTDLARTLGNRRQHNVHDSNPADQQADASYRTQDDIERPLGRLCLSQQGQGHGDNHIVFGMESLEHRGNCLSNRLDLLSGAYFHKNLMQFHMRPLEGAGGPASSNVTVMFPCDIQWNVSVNLLIRCLDSATGLLGANNSYDLVSVRPNPNRLAYRMLGSQYPACSMLG